MRRGVFILLLAAWSIAVIGRLGQFLYDSAALTADSHWQLSELDQRLSIELMILSFPLSVAAAPAVDVVGPVTSWCILALAGLFQWAVLVPATFGWLAARSARRRESPPGTR